MSFPKTFSFGALSSQSNIPVVENMNHCFTKSVCCWSKLKWWYTYTHLIGQGQVTVQSVQISDEFNEISSQRLQHRVVSRMLTESKEMLAKKLKKHISRDIWNTKKKNKRYTTLLISYPMGVGSIWNMGGNINLMHYSRHSNFLYSGAFAHHAFIWLL